MIVLKWLALLPVLLLGKLLTVVCAPVAALLSMRGDALPGWLLWMQTHDNSIDSLWQQPRHMAGYSTLRDVPQQSGFPGDIDWPVNPLGAAMKGEHHARQN